MERVVALSTPPPCLLAPIRASTPSNTRRSAAFLPQPLLLIASIFTAPICAALERACRRTGTAARRPSRRACRRHRPSTAWARPRRAASSASCRSGSSSPRCSGVIRVAGRRTRRRRRRPVALGRHELHAASLHGATSIRWPALWVARGDARVDAARHRPHGNSGATPGHGRRRHRCRRGPPRRRSAPPRHRACPRQLAVPRPAGGIQSRQVRPSSPFRSPPDRSRSPLSQEARRHSGTAPPWPDRPERCSARHKPGMARPKRGASQAERGGRSSRREQRETGRWIERDPSGALRGGSAPCWRCWCTRASRTR